MPENLSLTKIANDVWHAPSRLLETFIKASFEWGGSDFAMTPVEAYSTRFDNVPTPDLRATLNPENYIKLEYVFFIAEHLLRQRGIYLCSKYDTAVYVRPMCEDLYDRILDADIESYIQTNQRAQLGNFVVRAQDFVAHMQKHPIPGEDFQVPMRNLRISRYTIREGNNLNLERLFLVSLLMSTPYNEAISQYAADRFRRWQADMAEEFQAQKFSLDFAG